MNEYLKIILENSGIPDPYKSERVHEPSHHFVKKWKKKFISDKFSSSLLFICDSLSDRRNARKYAIGLMLSLAENNHLKPPAYYLVKSKFVSYWSKYSKGYSSESNTKFKKGELYLKSNLIIFEGIDELSNDYEKRLISEFVEHSLDSGIPFIFLSSKELNDEFAEKYNAQTLVSKIYDYALKVRNIK